MSENPGENPASFMFHSPLLTPAKHRTSMDSSRAPAHLPLQRAVPHSKTTGDESLVLSSMIPHGLREKSCWIMLDIYIYYIIYTIQFVIVCRPQQSSASPSVS